MADHRKLDFMVGLCVGLAIATLVLVPMSILTRDSDWRCEAVRRGCTEYDRQTGEWHWIEPKKAPQGDSKRPEADQAPMAP